jgi:hypothetical protein
MSEEEPDRAIPSIATVELELERIEEEVEEIVRPEGSNQSE